MEEKEKKLFIEEIMDSEEAPVVKSQACAKINWGECSEPDDAIEKARNGINSDITQFESENASIEAIAKIAKLSDDEKEIFTKMSLGHDNDINETVKKEIKEKIQKVFKNPENIVEALRYIHDTWCKNHGDNFQKIKDDGTKRDRDYQFTDLLLMSFDNDGAFADLMFIRPMLEFCGVEYNEPKIKEAFSKKRKEFLKENEITNRDALKDFIKKGSKSYDALTELKGFDNTPIDTYLTNDEILERMINKVMENARLEEVFKTLNEKEHKLEGGMQGAVTLKNSLVGSDYRVNMPTPAKAKTSIWTKIASKIKGFFGRKNNDKKSYEFNTEETKVNENLKSTLDRYKVPEGTKTTHGQDRKENDKPLYADNGANIAMINEALNKAENNNGER